MAIADRERGLKNSQSLPHTHGSPAQYTVSTITGAEQSPHLCLLPINAGNWQTATGANRTPVQRYTPVQTISHCFLAVLVD